MKGIDYHHEFFHALSYEQNTPARLCGTAPCFRPSFLPSCLPGCSLIQVLLAIIAPSYVIHRLLLDVTRNMYPLPVIVVTMVPRWWQRSDAMLENDVLAHTRLTWFAIQFNESPSISGSFEIVRSPRVVVRLFASRSSTEPGYELDNKRFQCWRRSAHNREIDLHRRPVCCRSAVPCLIVLMFGHKDKEI